MSLRLKIPNGRAAPTLPWRHKIWQKQNIDISTPPSPPSTLHPPPFLNSAVCLGIQRDEDVVWRVTCLKHERMVRAEVSAAALPRNKVGIGSGNVWLATSSPFNLWIFGGCGVFRTISERLWSGFSLPLQTADSVKVVMKIMEKKNSTSKLHVVRQPSLTQVINLKKFRVNLWPEGSFFVN